MSLCGRMGRNIEPWRIGLVLTGATQAILGHDEKRAISSMPPQNSSSAPAAS